MYNFFILHIYIDFMVCYGYLRVSTEKQDLETNKNLVLRKS